MTSYSPLRYPGGKSSMWKLLREVRRLNGLGGRAIAEPFAGGAGASLALLFMEDAPEITINDADEGIYSFWWSVTRNSNRFLELLDRTPVTVKEWNRQKALFANERPVSRLRRGFAAFYLNRCNRSGIIRNGGVIGGNRQKGKWRIDARFNKATLYARCRKIQEYRSRIAVSDEDGLALIRRLDRESMFLFVDPPYYAKGKTLYLNALNEDYHSRLAHQLRNTRKAAWVLTYDDCAAVRQLYKGWADVKPFGLRYSAAERGSGREVMITPKGMRLPAWQESASITW